MFKFIVLYFILFWNPPHESSWFCELNSFSKFLLELSKGITLRSEGYSNHLIILLLFIILLFLWRTSLKWILKVNLDLVIEKFKQMLGDIIYWSSSECWKRGNKSRGSRRLVFRDMSFERTRSTSFFRDIRRNWHRWKIEFRPLKMNMCFT